VRVVGNQLLCDVGPKSLRQQMTLGVRTNSMASRRAVILTDRICAVQIVNMPSAHMVYQSCPHSDAVGASRIAILHSATRLLLATGSERL
jgi:hypothetical protein